MPVVALIAVAALGIALAPALLAWGDALLARVAPHDVAAHDVAAHDVAAHDVAPHDVAPQTALPEARPAPCRIAPAWRWSLAGALALALPLAMWRVRQMVTPHLPAGFAEILLMLALMALLLAAVMDGAAHLIFPEVIAPPVLVALAATLLGGQQWGALLGGMLLGGGMMGLLFVAGRWFASAGALGLGDVWLGVSLGALLGPLGVARALVWGMLLLGVVSVALLATRRITLKSYLPLGTCLIAGALLSGWLAPPFWL